MASFEKFYPRLKKWEGGYAELPGDSGGCTNYGIAFNYNRQLILDFNQDGSIDCEDMRVMPPEFAKKVSKSVYWDAFLADNIKNQQIAEMLVDWGFHQGVGTVIMEAQRILGLPQDGKFGIATLAAVNQAPQKEFYEKLYKAREAKYRSGGSQYLEGFLNRLRDFSPTLHSIATNKWTYVGLFFLVLLLVFVYLYRKEVLAFYKQIFTKK
ncbi:MAG: hypothetical protein MUC49_02315 [Raineya sp.]|jgi:lysozyme family protein|nr:hypothetical protein [Raineya sp.]